MDLDTPAGDIAQQGETWAGEVIDDGAEGGNTSTVQHQHSDEHAQETDSNVASADVPGDSPSHGGPSGWGDAEAYDAESVAQQPQIVAAEPEPEQTTKSASQPAPRKPKSAGGFMIGDSDSEDDIPTPSSGNLLAGPNIQGQQAARSPLHNSTSAQDVPAADGPERQSAGTPKDGPVSSLASAPAADARSSLPVTAAVLPHDTAGLLELQIKEDPRGALDAWLALMAEHRRRNKTEELRAVYGRFLDVFPQAADIWVEYIQLELGLNDFVAAEALFGKCLKDVLNPKLWTVYLDYIRRRNDLSDSSGQARLTVTQSYEFVLDHIGLDKESGRIWQEYIQFINVGPGIIGGSSWQDQQKMDQLRKAYQRAICVPISNINVLWKEYDQFEMGLNKMTARKFLAERSPAYMSAKGANTALDNLTRGLHRSNLPRLPPIPGFEGDLEYAEQVELWKKWIAWEKSDPLDLRPDEPELLKKRILYCYRQALMALRFWPEIWVDAAAWCFENDITEDSKEKGLDFLLRGIEANPESILLALKHADRIELTHPVGEGDEAKAARAAAVRAPHDKILDTLYELSRGLKEKEKADIARLEESLAAAEAEKAADDDDDETAAQERAAAARKLKDERIALLRHGISAQVDLLSKSLTYVWIALARAMRRIQGKGDPKSGGLRRIFGDARARGKLGSEIYIAIAKMEWKCYNDKAAGKIFDRGAKLFPEDPHYMIEFIEYLVAHHDTTNSLVVFETCVNKLTSKPENVYKARPLLAYMHKRESDYGDLARVVELEKRMAALYPDDPKLARFTARFSTEKFDPIAARIIVSPGVQLRPKMIIPSVEKATSVQPSPRPALRQPVSPRPQFLPATNSPKRPFPDDFDDFNAPRKMLRGDRDFQRGESPALKGAAGRRLDQQRRTHGHGPASSSAPPAPLPTMVTFLLGQMPGAPHYEGDRINAGGLVRLLQNTDVDLGTYEAKQATKNSRPSAQHGRQQAPSHARQVSSDYAQYLGRNSPGGGGRPHSPYGGERGRLVPASSTYRQPSRPEPRDGYEPPPAAYRQEVAPQGYGAPPPGQYDNAVPAWQPPQQPAPQPMPVAMSGQPQYALPQTQAYPAAAAGPPSYYVNQQPQQQPPPQQGPYGTYRY